MNLSPGDVVADKYRIQHRIGEGGMGTVYAATNELTGRTVALKWLQTHLLTSENFAQRFMREARVCGRLDHPNIVNVFDVGRHRGSIFLVMELLRGESYDVWLRRTSRSPVECITRLMPALRAVAAAHAIGVVHRDLKPEHVFLCKDPDGTIRQTKVLDFGIAKDIATSESDTSLTSPGSLIGTVNYMAPEQIRNSSRADARSDIYSLGVILYYALGGKLPYESENVADLIVKIVDSKPRPLAKTNPKLPRKLADVVMRAMSKDPKDRYESVAALALALEPHAGNAVFDEARASAAFPTSVPPPREEPAPGQTTSLSSALPGELVAQRKPDSLALGRIVLLLAIGMFFLTFGGSWLLSRNEPGASGGEMSAGIGLQRVSRSTVSNDVVAPSPAEPPASGSGPDTPANESVAKQSAPAAVRRERQLTLRIHAAQQARPETPRVTAPEVAQPSSQALAPAPSIQRESDTSSFVYEKNPYLRH